MTRSLRRLPIVFVPLIASCVVIHQSGSVDRSTAEDMEGPRQIDSAMKAFLLDGSSVVYPYGARITADSILGRGARYSLGLADTTYDAAVPMDSLIGIEAFQGRTQVASTVIASLGLTAMAVVGSVPLLTALFGSCPTFYAPAEQGGALQAEAFSYSIAPLLEGRDLDATSIATGGDGVVRLELRNEALETHYINHLDLLAVDHAPGVRVMPDDRDAPIGVIGEVAPARAVDRGGRDVRMLLDAADEAAFASTPDRIRAATDADALDYIELTFPRVDGDAVLVLRLRNSLLNTVLFYDLMLGRSGAAAVDWIGRDMARIGTVVELGRWFQDAMGLRVETMQEGEWSEVARISDTGPIAWEEVGVRIPPTDSDSVRVRLQFLTDAWRIDRVMLAGAADLATTTRVPVARMKEGSELVGAEALDRLARPDDAYLATYPGTSAELEFDPPPTPAGSTRSYLLSSQGYYTEWVRAEWIRGVGSVRAFRPSDDTVETLMQLWRSKKDAFEADFYASRIPVR